MAEALGDVFDGQVHSAAAVEFDLERVFTAAGDGADVTVEDAEVVSVELADHPVAFVEAPIFHRQHQRSESTGILQHGMRSFVEIIHIAVMSRTHEYVSTVVVVVPPVERRSDLAGRRRCGRW